MSAKSFFKLGMHPLAPRWFKIWCLKMIMKHVALEMTRVIEKMGPEKKKAFDDAISAAVAKHGKMRA